MYNLPLCQVAGLETLVVYLRSQSQVAKVVGFLIFHTLDFHWRFRKIYRFTAWFFPNWGWSQEAKKLRKEWEMLESQGIALHLRWPCSPEITLNNSLKAAFLASPAVSRLTFLFHLLFRSNIKSFPESSNQKIFLLPKIWKNQTKKKVPGWFFKKLYNTDPLNSTNGLYIVFLCCDSDWHLELR